MEDDTIGIFGDALDYLKEICYVNMAVKRTADLREPTRVYLFKPIHGTRAI